MKNAFLQAPQEKPLNVHLRGGQGVGATAWFDFFTGYPAEELNYKFSAVCPRQGRNEQSVLLVYVDGLISNVVQSASMKSFFQRFKTGLTPV